MSRFLNLLIAIAFASAVICGNAIAQTQPATKMAPSVATDKDAAKKKAAEATAMKKQKDADCKKKAKEQKIGLMKRRSFMKDCMAK